jgi:hypothetical protein
MNEQLDRLYELLPVVYRQRDAEQGWPLRALLQVITEQVNVVETDIAQLYENWFIETCEDWVVPYIGDLIGYQIVHEAGEPGDISSAQGRLRTKILIPRRAVANTLRYRRRKGSLALLELLAGDVAGWPARAVEFYTLLGWTQALNHRRLQRGQTVDLRRGAALELLNGPFEALAHMVDVRRLNSARTPERYNIPSLGLFVWRLKSYPVTYTPAYCLEEVGPHCYMFSVLGNDTPLYNRPQPETEPTHIAEEVNLPTPIRRRAFEERIVGEDGVEHTQAAAAYYGPSLMIWAPGWPRRGAEQPIPRTAIIPADLTDWQYRTPRNFVAVDPELGRIAFPTGQLPKQGVWVSYHYGFSADIGGGEYPRPLSQPIEHKLYRVSKSKPGYYETIGAALEQWARETPKPLAAVIELADSGVYVERLNIELAENETLHLRAANRTRPVIQLLDWHTDRPDFLTVKAAKGSRFTLDGLLITGRGVHIEALSPENEDEAEPPARIASPGRPVQVTIRHSTLVPGWSLHANCEPKRPAEPSLELFNLHGQVQIEHSIIGSILVLQDEVQSDPIPIQISDSVVDATGSSCDGPECEALSGYGGSFAHAILTVLRSTVFGHLRTHAIELAENSIFEGLVRVVRSQRGCMRFCYVRMPGSRTPRRYHCQPDMVEQAIEAELRRAVGQPDQADLEAAKERERERVRPQFNSTRYGTPTYCQLAHTCAEEIKRGADDESEMGVFHDLYQPQRAANLRAHLEEYVPAGLNAGLIYAS